MNRSLIVAAGMLFGSIAAPSCANPAGRAGDDDPAGAGGAVGAAPIAGGGDEVAAGGDGGDGGHEASGGDRVAGDAGASGSDGSGATGNASGAVGAAVGGAVGAAGSGGEAAASQAGATTGGMANGGALGGALGGTAGELGCGPASGATVSVAGAAGTVAGGAGGNGGAGGGEALGGAGGFAGAAGAVGAGAVNAAGAAGASGDVPLAGAGGAGSGAAWPCGEPLLDARDGKSYPTLALGGLCWMGKNLDVGERIDMSAAQSATDRIQKYCYGDDDAMCERFGGLYQWDHAMQYTEAEGATGICPLGWRIATDRDWKALEIAAGMEPGVAEQDGWRGDGVGTALKVGGSSGFEAPLGGMVVYGGSYNFPGYGYHWTSTLGTPGPWRRCFTAESTYPPDTVGRWQTWGQQYALPVRCVTDLRT